MIEFKQWCTVFCTGHEAAGEITIEFDTGTLNLPICDSCLHVLQDDPQKALDLRPTDVLEFDPEDEALGLIPRQ